jgi:hypothetical protein
MSIQTQAVIHFMRSAVDLLATIRPWCRGNIAVRPMHGPQYEILEAETIDGHLLLIHVFGSSHVQEDYPDLFREPSVLISAEFNPVLVRIIRGVAKAGEGFFRRTDQEPWEKL